MDESAGQSEQRVPPPPSLASPGSLPARLAEELRKRRERSITRPDVPSFLEHAQRIPTAKGELLDFDRFPFQREIYEVFGDLTVPDADVMKSVQVGVSEMLTRLAIWLADVYGMTSLTLFPAGKQMEDFSDTRVNPLRERSAYLQARTQLGPDWPWNKRLKRFGDGYCYYRGSESTNELLAIDADLVALDEYDSLVLKNVAQAERRVVGSKLGLIRRVGVPTDEDHGIADRFAKSDKRQWHARCARCADWQPIRFHTNVDQDGARVVCRRCRTWINVAEGEWVAEHPDRDRPGFHVHRLLVPGDDALSRRRIRTIVEASKGREPYKVAAFWRNDLGLPYGGDDDGLDRSTIAAAISAAESHFGQPIHQLGAYAGTNIVTAGIDVAGARNLHVRISEHLDPPKTRGRRKRALFIGEVANFGELEGLLHRYQVHFACIDHLPEYRLSYGLASRFPGRVYVVHYLSQADPSDPIRLNSEDSQVSVLRFAILDATIAIFRQQRNLLPEDLPATYVEHMIANRRRVERDHVGRERVFHDNRGQPDDYFQAEVYDVVATEVAMIRLYAETLEELEEVVALDDVLDFKRSRVNDYEEMEYRPGPGSEDPFEYGPID